jgi:glycosyltransferase involved in cell wall biosynthesis
MTSVSVVIATRDEPRLEKTVEGFLRELPDKGEVIVVDDASRSEATVSAVAVDQRVRMHRSSTRLGVARARNTGARLAVGDLLVFADAHVDVRPGWLSLLDHLNDPGVGAAGPTLVDGPSLILCRGERLVDLTLNTEWLEMRGDLPYVVPLLPGFFLAARRQVFVNVGGFDSGMVGWGIEDIEFSMHLGTLGYRCMLVPEVEVVHAPVSTPDYHDEWAPALQNILRLGHVHFSHRRIKELHDGLKGYEAFDQALRAVAASNVDRRRAAVQRARRFDDDWFFALSGVG